MIRSTMTAMLALASAMAATTPLSAEPQPAPNALLPLLQCRKIGDAAARLACFDTQAGQLDQANTGQGLVVMDRGEIQKARRSIFGLSLPTLSFLDRDPKGKTEEINEINAKIAQASPGPNGNWTFVLDDGARWTQIEPKIFARDPKPGMPVRIRRAAMGSFLANIDGQTAVRVARVR